MCILCKMLFTQQKCDKKGQSELSYACMNYS